MRRAAAVTTLVGLLLVVAAGPAAADPAGPTNYRSVVTRIEPGGSGPGGSGSAAVGSVTVEVLGGDAFVYLTVESGVTAVVDGYEGEPYLRFNADGTVERNNASTTRWLNDGRYGVLDVEVPPEADNDAPPRWEVVASGGAYAWHDHRVHWMVPGVPAHIDAGAGTPQRVTPWDLELTVDGQPVVVSGELDWLPPASPLAPLVVTLLVAAVGVLAVLRRPGAVLPVAVVGAVAAAVVGVAASVGLPPGADADPALVILPGVAVLLALATLALRGRAGTAPRLVGAFAGVPLLVWSVLLWRAFVSPIVPTVLPDLVARLLIGVVLGAGLAALFSAARILAGPRLTIPTPATPTPDAT